MMRWELLLLSISLSLVTLSTVSINTPTQFLYNFQQKELSLPPLVEKACVIITQNKTNVISEILVLSNTKSFIVNVSSDGMVNLPISSGNYEFFIIKEFEFNTTTKKFEKINTTYNATMTLEILKMKVLLNNHVIFIAGVMGTIIGGVIYVVRIIKTRTL
ncbi:hypothetical protein V6M85_03110 [Sulfolobus tengchongensis]|uniref:Uncharacterized protein n=1 Tax=Sulfolobus tengchongensis TaxID=207809 RepID=A0AAX4L2J1_9CREN